MVEPEDTANLKAQLEVISKETAFLKKYFALRKRCEQLQQVNIVEGDHTHTIYHFRYLLRLMVNTMYYAGPEEHGVVDTM